MLPLFLLGVLILVIIVALARKARVPKPQNLKNSNVVPKFIPKSTPQIRPIVVEKPKEEDENRFDNLSDIYKLRGGSMRFTLIIKDENIEGGEDDVACEAEILEIDYVPLGPGAINVTIGTIKFLSHPIDLPDITADLTISCFMAQVVNRPRELLVVVPVPIEPFGEFFSFHKG